MMAAESRADPPSDDELVERARSGDGRAMDLLVERHHGVVFRTCLAIVGDEDLARDASQDCLIKAFRALDRFRGDASFRTWLLAIAGNEARGHLRKIGRRRELGLDDVGALSAPGHDPSTEAVLRSEAARVREAVQGLPPKQRLSVTLRIDDGLSFREIGEIIGSSEGSARVNYHHGIRRLRDWLEP